MEVKVTRAAAHTLTPGTRAPVQGTLPRRIPRSLGRHALPLEPPRNDMAPRLPLRAAAPDGLAPLQDAHSTGTRPPHALPHRRTQQPASRVLLQPASHGPRTSPRFQPPDLRPHQQRRRQPDQNARQGKIRRSGGLQAGRPDYVHRAHRRDTRHTNRDGNTISLRPDIRVDGLRDTGITILADVSITHIMDSAANHASQPRPRQGNSAPTATPS